MMTVKVELEFEIPETLKPSPTQKEVEEWVMFHVGYRASLSGSNPLIHSDLESAVTDCYVHDINE